MKFFVNNIFSHSTAHSTGGGIDVRLKLIRIARVAIHKIDSSYRDTIDTKNLAEILMFFPRTSGKQERVLKNVGSFRLRSTWTLMSSLQGGGTPLFPWREENRRRKSDTRGEENSSRFVVEKGSVSVCNYSSWIPYAPYGWGESIPVPDSARAIEHPPTKNKEDEGRAGRGKDNCHCSHWRIFQLLSRVYFNFQSNKKFFRNYSSAPRVRFRVPPSCLSKFVPPSPSTTAQSLTPIFFDSPLPLEGSLSSAPILPRFSLYLLPWLIFRYLRRRSLKPLVAVSRRRFPSIPPLPFSVFLLS